MKVSVVFLFLLFSSTVFGQKKITEEFDSTPLKEVIDVLDTKYGVHIAYDPVLIVNVKVSVLLNQIPVDEALKRILQNTQFSVSEVKPNYYSLVPSKKKWSLEGRIIDEESSPIAYVKLRIKNTYRGTYSDLEGNYMLDFYSDIAPVIEVSSFGFKKQYIRADKLETMGTLTLKRDVVNYPEMTVEYLTEGISISNDLSSISIRPKELGTVPGTTEPDVFQLVQNVPGINSVNSTVNEIQIRGGTADQNKLLWDGIPLYHPGHFNGMISSVNPNIVHKVDLHRGVYDPYFGGKVSGLIDLHSIDFVPKNMIGSAGINMLQGDLFLVTPIGSKFAVMLSGRRSYSDLWRSPTYKRYAEKVFQETEILDKGLYNNDFELDGISAELQKAENELKYYDLNGKLIYAPDSNNLLTLSAVFTRDNHFYSKLEMINEGVSIEDRIDYESTSSNVGVGVHWKHHWNKQWVSDFRANFAEYTYTYTNDRQVIEDSVPWSSISEKLNNVQHTDFKWRNEFKINDNHTLNFGYQLTFNDVYYSLFSSDEEDSVEQIGVNEGFTNILHLNYIFKSNRWLAKVGLRASHLDSNPKVYTEPRIYSQYRVTESLKFKASFGLQYQFISQVDHFTYSQLGLSNRVWVMAENEEIPVITSNITDVGVVWQKKGWYIEAQAYYKQLYDIVSFSEDPNLSSGLVRGNAKAKGVDVLIKKRWKNYRSWVSYSLGEVIYRFDDLYPEQFLAPFNQTHTFKWVNTLTWRQFEFSSAFKIASGKPYTPIQEIALVGDPNDPGQDIYDLYEIEYGKPNSKKLPVYHQLDLTLFYSFPKSPEKHWKIKLGVSCFNVYNHYNILSRAHELEITGDDPLNAQYETYSIEKYYLSITPNVLVRIELD